MLLSKEIEMKVDWSSVKRYETLGYGKMRQGDLFFIKVEDLKPNSLQLVDVSCDYCNVEFKRRYSEYIRNTKIQGKFSCLKCTNNKYKVTCLEKYGVDNISRLPITHNKIRETNIERYGVTSYSKLDSFKEEHKDKMLFKYGFTSFSKTNEFLVKQKITCLERFGVENASQNSEIFSKQQKKRFEIHIFRDTELYYQGSYEKDFLDKYYDLFEITKIECINYSFDGSRVYYPDFYLPKYNLIIEIKSSYTYERFLEKNNSKQKACLELGYNHIFIIDKNYDELNKIIY
jgi:hypothetical protein